MAHTMRDCKSLGITSLKRKREERRFVDLRIILIFRCGDQFFKQLPALNWMTSFPKYGSTIKNSLLGTIGITFFVT